MICFLRGMMHRDDEDLLCHNGSSMTKQWIGDWKVQQGRDKEGFQRLEPGSAPINSVITRSVKDDWLYPRKVIRVTVTACSV